MTTLPVPSSLLRVSIPTTDSDPTQSSRQDCQDPVKPTAGILIHSTQTKRTSRRVSFSLEPPLVYEYEPEHDPHQPTMAFFDEGWPGRAKKAMDSTSFIDFKSRIEAQLSAINHPVLMSQLESDPSSLSPLSSRYRDRKSPLVEPLSLCPEDDESDTDGSLSPNLDSPLIATPSDTVDTWFIRQPVK